jgi:GNAT superfamily N-acetyltransferase
LKAQSITYRSAVPQDADALAVLRYEFRSQLAEVQEQPAEFIVRCTQWMRARLSSAEWLAWLAESEREMVGHIWLHPIEKIPNPIEEPERLAYITNTYVRDNFRALGAGGELLRLALDWCRRHEVDRVILWPSERSRSLYARHGFVAPDDVLQLSLAGLHS